MRTFTSYIAVSKELLGLLVVELLSGFFCQLSFVVEFLEPVCGELMVSL